MSSNTEHDSIATATTTTLDNSIQKRLSGRSSIRVTAAAAPAPALMMVVPLPCSRPKHRSTSEPVHHHHPIPPKVPLNRRWSTSGKSIASMNSLTDEEERVLKSFEISSNAAASSEKQKDETTTTTTIHHLSADAPSPSPTTTTTTMETAARGKLLSTLRARRRTMTQQEFTFLHDLVQNTAIQCEQLEQVTGVLEHDPLFESSQSQHLAPSSASPTSANADMDHEGNEQVDVDDQSCLPQKHDLQRLRSLLPDASFRREVWLQSEADNINNIHNNLSNQNSGNTNHFKDSDSSLMVIASERHDSTNSTTTSATNMSQSSNDDAPPSPVPSSDSNNNNTITTPTTTTSKRKPGFWGSVLFKIQESLKLKDATSIASGASGEEEEESRNPEESIDDGNGIVPLAYTVLSQSVLDLIDTPTVLTPPLMNALRPHLPFTIQQDNFWLKYSLVRGDGGSMRTLLHKVRSSSRTILAVETTRGEVFGSFTTSPWRCHSGYYGSGEAFLWQLDQSRYSRCDTVEEQMELERQVTVYPWSGKNRCVQYSPTYDSDLMVGGGGLEEDAYDDDDNNGSSKHNSSSSGSSSHDLAAKLDDGNVEYGPGLVIRQDLEHGYTCSCLTFQSPPLLLADENNNNKTSDGEFEIANLEVWTLTPMDSLEQAEKLELSRQFIFDHGNFAM